MKNIYKYLIIGVIISLIIFQIYSFNLQNNSFKEEINLSNEEIGPINWITNNDFSTSANWFYSKGDQGDNSTVDANISGGQANYKIVGDIKTFNDIQGTPNSSTSQGWKKFNNGGYLFPDTSEINIDGCYVSHIWSEDPNQFPSVHFRKNVSMPVDMSQYNITSVSLEAIFNATVLSNVDAGNDDGVVEYYAIGDFVTFYVLISDINYSNSYPVALYKTEILGQNTPANLSISDHLINAFDDKVIIDALNSAFEKDPDHANFTITIGIDIYSEDNYSGTDTDTYSSLFVNECNLTFTYERIVDKFSSVSWNQVGDIISGENIQITDANLRFSYKIDQVWPSNLSPFSEMRILINNNPHKENILLTSANLTFEAAKTGGFDITSLILKDVNISLSIQIFIANDFGLDNNITISIDDVYLYISYEIIQPGVNIFPLIIGLSAGIVALIIGFVLYQVHFKYPKMVRRVRKLNKKIKKGKRLKIIELNNRDLIIKNNISLQKQFLNLEQEKQIKFKES
ncbi:MAG: hypothetical protein ACFE85_00030 [Candidatus Hodarchaeota archaeon]